MANKANTQTYNLNSEIADGLSGSTSVTYRGNVNGGTTGSIVDRRGQQHLHRPDVYYARPRASDCRGPSPRPSARAPRAIVYVDGSTDGQFFMNQNATIANDFVIVGNGFNENNTRRGAIRLDSSATNTPALSGSITLVGDAAIGNNSATAGMGVISGVVGGGLHAAARSTRAPSA